MINGEGARETIPEVACSERLDGILPWQEHKSDVVSPISSRYSSCGDSEFERYCSANSVMGTPSLCSSIGSMRNFGFGDDVGLEGFNLGGRLLDRSNADLGVVNGVSESEQFVLHNERSDVGIGYPGEWTKEGFGIKNRMKIGGYCENSITYGATCGSGSSDIMATIITSEPQFQMVAEKDISVEGGNECSEPCVQHGQVKNVRSIRENHLSHRTHNAKRLEVKTVHNSDGNSSKFEARAIEGLPSLAAAEESVSVFSWLNSATSGLNFEGGETAKVDDSTSSRNEPSDDEDSMYQYGSDDEHSHGLYFRRNLQCPVESEVNSENPLFISSSIAFGLEDWNDFTQETEGDSLTSLSFNKFQDQINSVVETERNSLNATHTIMTRPQNLDRPDRGKCVTDIPLPICSKEVQGTDLSAETTDSHSLALIGFQDNDKPEQVAEIGDIHVANYIVHGRDELLECSESSSIIGSVDTPKPMQDTRKIPVTRRQVLDADGSEEYLDNCSVSNVFEPQQDPLPEKPCLDFDLKTMDHGIEMEHPRVDNKEFLSTDNNSCAVERNRSEHSKAQSVAFSDGSINQFCSMSTEPPVTKLWSNDWSSSSAPSTLEDETSRISKNYSLPADVVKNLPVPVKTDNLEIDEFCDEIVLEMEEILLESIDSPGARFPQGNRFTKSQQFLPLRDGGSTATPSGVDDANPQVQHRLRIDGVEVVGAMQKKGDVSFSERLVGVKEYTVYKIRVWSSKDQWEVERRYRDFFTLYRRLKTLFAEQGWLLPSSWSSVEKESRNFFGNASPDVISERSVLIQECLRSIIHSEFFSSLPAALIWFLSPQDSFPSSPASNTLARQSSYFSRGTDAENFPTLGKTISLIVEIRHNKSTKQMLESQHYTCAGCYKHFLDGKTLMQDVVQTFGWGKPRLCEYTGQLFCSSCHTNETTVLPARVLHHWDFTLCPVSQMAKSFLESIHDKPMLCVGAVNPLLFSKVPALRHVMDVRKKIVTILPYVRCPFRRIINRGLGSRRYLLESNDFFALRDLIDLSKGAFAVLPMMVETIMKKILEHITEQCLVCCDVGVACGARQACHDPSSLIFPFQLEDEFERCTSCELVFHKPCFRKLTSCICGMRIGVEETHGSLSKVCSEAGGEVGRALDFFGRRSGSGFLSALFSKGKREKSEEHKEGDNVILMGSLPSTHLS